MERKQWACLTESSDKIIAIGQVVENVRIGIGSHNYENLFERLGDVVEANCTVEGVVG